MLHSMTNGELKDIALGIHKGKIFTDKHIPTDEQKQMVPIVFMALMFMDKEDIKMMEDVGMIYEYLDKESLIGVNGYPCFMSMKCLSITDTNIVVSYVTQYREIEAIATSKLMAI